MYSRPHESSCPFRQPCVHTHVPGCPGTLVSLPLRHCIPWSPCCHVHMPKCQYSPPRLYAPMPRFCHGTVLPSCPQCHAPNPLSHLAPTCPFTLISILPRVHTAMCPCGHACIHHNAHTHSCSPMSAHAPPYSCAPALERQCSKRSPRPAAHASHVVTRQASPRIHADLHLRGDWGQTFPAATCTTAPLYRQVYVLS